MKDEKVDASSNKNNSTTNSKPSPTLGKFIRSTRRGFLKTAGMSAAALAASSVIPGGGLVEEAQAVEVGPPSQNPNLRAAQSDQVRKTTSGNESTAIKDAFPHATNGDEERYANQTYAGNFSKTLPHDPATALATTAGYQSLLNGVTQGTKTA